MIDKTTRVRVLMEIAAEQSGDPATFKRLAEEGRAQGRRIAEHVLPMIAANLGSEVAEVAIQQQVEATISRHSNELREAGTPETEIAAYSGNLVLAIEERWAELIAPMHEADAAGQH